MTENEFKNHKLKACLIGCAVGDSIGLPYEGISPRRIRKLLKSQLEHKFVFGRGMLSDDTDHTIFVLQSLIRHPRDVDAFSKALAWRLRLWLLTIPAGIGFATLRSICKLWLGFSPRSSGVFSAGNGAAMRSAIIGIFHADDNHLRKQFVSASSRITHADSKADYGAQAVAAIASELTVNPNARPDIVRLEHLLREISADKEWLNVVDITLNACRSGSLDDSLCGQTSSKGVSGYVYHTIPAAVTAWYIHYGDFRGTIESIVRLGGDTDTVAAIAGSLAAISVGSDNIPESWVTGLADYPHSLKFMSDLTGCSASSRTGFSILLFVRSFYYIPIVLIHALRRLLPPY